MAEHASHGDWQEHGSSQQQLAKSTRDAAGNSGVAEEAWDQAWEHDDEAQQPTCAATTTSTGKSGVNALRRSGDLASLRSASRFTEHHASPTAILYSSHSSTTKYNREWYKLKVQSSTYVYVLPSGSMNVCFLCAARSYAAFS